MSTPRTQSLLEKLVKASTPAHEDIFEVLEFARQLERENAELVKALGGMIDQHLSLVDSGDCGNLEFRIEPQVILAISLLGKLELS